MTIMKELKLTTTLLITTFLWFTSCGTDPEFSTNKTGENTNISPIETFSSSICASYTHIKPEVDFLFLWDNSSSQIFVNDKTKQALNNTINLISQKFDYRILMAPLIDYAGSTQYLVSSSPVTVSSPIQVIPQDKAINYIGSFSFVAGGKEGGIDRAADILETSNGIFRTNAYTMIVLMSNGDDNSWYTSVPNPAQYNTYLDTNFSRLLNARDNVLSSLQMRFMTLVAHTACRSEYTEGIMYKKMSEKIYQAPYSNNLPSPTDQVGRSTPDSYDICTTEFEHLFDGINSAITDVLIPHVYDYWPVASTSDPTFDPGQIKVTKVPGGEIPEDPTNGFTYVGLKTNQNTRIKPTPGEPYTGYLIKLNGTAKVTYPECLLIDTQAPADFYGYVQMHAEPVLSSIQLLINGKEIAQDATNGWQYIGFRSSQNMKITSPTDRTPATPADLKTGYFLEVKGSAVYTNASKIEVRYLPAATN